jgi:lipopolysaccharide/colanic/teichoic acid biosynthesis glycosyltransferase
MVDENDILAKYDDAYKAYVDVILPIKQRYYEEYVKSRGFWFDLKIIFLTVRKIILR